MMTPASRYIVLEGVDGSGKDTVADALTKRLIAEGQRVARHREPDESNPIGKLCRQLLAEGDFPRSHMPLFLADRLASRPKLQDFLEGGGWVIQSRCWLSTLVYQADLWNTGLIAALHDECELMTGRIFLLDVPVGVALARMGDRKREYYETGERLERCRERYLSWARSAAARAESVEGDEPDGFVGWPLPEGVDITVIDGTLPSEEVEASVWRGVLGE